jgi:hypothetical protein
MFACTTFHVEKEKFKTIGDLHHHTSSLIFSGNQIVQRIAEHLTRSNVPITHIYYLSCNLEVIENELREY